MRHILLTEEEADAILGRLDDDLPDLLVKVLEAKTGPTKYTVWVCKTTGVGTHHVSSHEADDIEDAKRQAIEETASDWDYDEDQSTDDLHVLGICTGDITIVEWDESVFGEG